VKTVVNVKKDGVDLELAVKSPSPEHKKEAQIIYAQAVTRALTNKMMPRDRLDTYLRTNGIVDDAYFETEQKLIDSIKKNVKKLSAGGIKKSEGYDLAQQIKKDRAQLVELRTKVTSLDNITAEAFGENARFNYLVSVCTVYNSTGELYFKDVEDYESQSSTDIAFECATALAAMVAGVNPKFEESLPENKFLKKFGYDTPVEEIIEPELDVDKAEFYD
jgi:hypothetical protein